MIDDACLVVGS